MVEIYFISTIHCCIILFIWFILDLCTTMLLNIYIIFVDKLIKIIFKIKNLIKPFNSSTADSNNRFASQCVRENVCVLRGRRGCWHPPLPPPTQLLSEKSEPVKGADWLTQQLFLTIHSSAVLSLHLTLEGKKLSLSLLKGSGFNSRMTIISFFFYCVWKRFSFFLHYLKEYSEFASDCPRFVKFPWLQWQNSKIAFAD